MMPFALFAIAFGLGLYWLAVFRADRIHDPGALRTAWLLFAVSLPIEAVAAGLDVWFFSVAAWSVMGLAVAFVHFAVDPLITNDPRRRKRDEPRKPPSYEPILPGQDDTSHIPIPPEVPQI